MKKIYLTLLASIGFGVLVIAQPTLTQANFIPAVGTSQTYFVADTNSVLDNTTGANVVFDYTLLRGYNQSQIQYFVDPTTTANSGDFPTATYTDTTGGFPGNMKYNKDFTDSLDVIGLVLDINSFGTVVAKYDVDPEILMKFPFTYGNSYSDNYAGQFTSPSAPPTNASGTVTVNADAWGTLQLPMGVSIDSVLRVVRVENMLTDTIFLPFPLPTIMPVPVNATQISYYKPSISKNPLLSFITADVNGDTTINVISQYPMFGVNVEELDDKVTNLKLFPNPSNNNTTLTFNIENNANVKITLLNNLGQTVQNVMNEYLPKGDNKITIKNSNLSKGLYFVNITIDNKTITKKLLLE